jgi:protein tyrosine phosphatase (PTP) superfamily phosphohydrolase (DUF442 family)
MSFKHFEFESDNTRGDQREEHNSGTSVSLEALKHFGVTYQHIPVDDGGNWEEEISELTHLTRKLQR